MQRRSIIAISVLAVFCAVPGLANGAEIHTDYDLYAAGFDVAQVSAAFELSRSAYEMRLAYHTTGLAGLFYRGHQLNTVQGVWQADQPLPRHFYGVGVWHGEDRTTQIDYVDGQPFVRTLVPPDKDERQPVPPALRAHSIDTLSALALLMRRVEETGRCDAAVRTYDGRRATEVEARTVGQEVLSRTGRSIYNGPALRCDFQGRMLAGFKLNDNDPEVRKPLHGSAWFAALGNGEAPVPVRMRFETRWFGDATMYLTAANAEPNTSLK